MREISANASEDEDEDEITLAEFKRLGIGALI